MRNILTPLNCAWYDMTMFTVRPTCSILLRLGHAKWETPKYKLAETGKYEIPSPMEHSFCLGLVSVYTSETV